MTSREEFNESALSVSERLWAKGVGKMHASWKTVEASNFKTLPKYAWGAVLAAVGAVGTVGRRVGKLIRHGQKNSETWEAWDVRLSRGIAHYTAQETQALKGGE
jgi:hypothetical protein